MSVEKAHEYGHTHFSEVPSPIPWSLGLIPKMFSNGLLVIHQRMAVALLQNKNTKFH
jgi:hypothetical protein